ncbi:ribosome biogenesis protein [Candidatus Woesearchaeota archaeon]|jgi:H/ACA ribonucleoprotein complex subunit 3|nr:ribosome biogenesis protein [Candidatus Woesearchaeota archaeon]
MAAVLKQCAICKQYTLKQNHCQKLTILPRPPKYSPIDKLGKYRREAKKDFLKEKGLL